MRIIYNHSFGCGTNLTVQSPSPQCVPSLDIYRIDITDHRALGTIHTEDDPQEMFVDNDGTCELKHVTLRFYADALEKMKEAIDKLLEHHISRLKETK